MSVRSPVPDRILERVRLGELSDEETHLVLERLEAEEGGRERLESMIADDERFLMQYPPDVMAARIREKHQRWLEAHQQRQPPLGRHSRPAFLVVASSATALVVFIVSVVLSNDDGSQHSPSTSLQPSTEQADGHHDGTEALGVPPPHDSRSGETTDGAGHSGSSQDDDVFVARWDGRSGTRVELGRSGELTAELVVQEGQIVELIASGVDEVTVDDPEIADIMGTNVRYYLEGFRAGVTRVRFLFHGELVKNVFVRVAPGIDSMALETVAIERQPFIDDCFERQDERDGRLRVRMLVDRDGRVSLALPEMTTVPNALQDCLLGDVFSWSFPESEALRTGSWMMSWGEGAVCQPGEDC